MAPRGTFTVFFNEFTVFFNELGMSFDFQLREKKLKVQEQKEKGGHAPLPCSLDKSPRCNTQAQKQSNTRTQTGIKERARLNCSKHSFVLSVACRAIEWMLSKIRWFCSFHKFHMMLCRRAGLSLCIGKLN